MICTWWTTQIVGWMHLCVHFLPLFLFPHSHEFASWQKLIKIHELESSSIPTNLLLFFSHMIASITTIIIVVLKTYLWAMNELITIVNSYWRPKEFKCGNKMKRDVYRERDGWGVGGVYIYIYICVQYEQECIFEEEKRKRKEMN